jgi:hypothetical protein
MVRSVTKRTGMAVKAKGLAARTPSRDAKSPEGSSENSFRLLVMRTSWATKMAAQPNHSHAERRMMPYQSGWKSSQMGSLLA